MRDCSGEVEEEGVGMRLSKKAHTSVGDPVHVLNSDFIESEEAGVVVIQAVGEIEADLKHSLACVLMVGFELSFVGSITGATFEVFKTLQATNFYDVVFPSHSSGVTGGFQ